MEGLKVLVNKKKPLENLHLLQNIVKYEMSRKKYWATLKKILTENKSGLNLLQEDFPMTVFVDILLKSCFQRVCEYKDFRLYLRLEEGIQNSPWRGCYSQQKCHADLLSSSEGGATDFNHLISCFTIFCIIINLGDIFNPTVPSSRHLPKSAHWY